MIKYLAFTLFCSLSSHAANTSVMDVLLAHQGNYKGVTIAKQGPQGPGIEVAIRISSNSIEMARAYRDGGSSEWLVILNREKLQKDCSVQIVVSQQSGRAPSIVCTYPEITSNDYKYDALIFLNDGRIVAGTEGRGGAIFFRDSDGKSIVNFLEPFEAERKIAKFAIGNPRY